MRTITRSLTPLQIVLLIALTVAMTFDGFGQTTADQLADLAPRIDTNQIQLRTLHFSASAHFQQSTLVVRLTCDFETPASRACIALHDGVPVFVAVGDRILTYSALDGMFQWKGDWGVYVGTQDNKFRWDYGIFSPGSSKTGIHLDLASLIAKAGRQRTVMSVGDGRFQWEGQTEEGSRVSAWIEPARRPFYSRLRIANAQGVVWFELEQLVGDGPIPSTAFQTPKWEDELPVAPATEVTLETSGSS